MRRSLIPRSLGHHLNAYPSPSRIAICQPPWTTTTRTTTPQSATTSRTNILTPQRTFFSLPDLSAVLPSSNNNNGNNRRTLTATRTLPYPPSPLFNVIASVDSYSQFLPFLNASTVTARDPHTNLPTRAFLTIGYGPLSETFTSRVDCDPAALVVEARSGAMFGVDSKDGQDSDSSVPGIAEGMFEYISTRWELVPGEGDHGRPMTRVDLRIQLEFRSQFHATIMSAVEGQMAGVMIEAFEKRIREVHEDR